LLAECRRARSVDVPVADIRVYPFATRLLIGAEGINVKFPILPRMEVFVGCAPWVHGDLVQIAALLPVPDRRVCRLVDQCLESLVRCRVAKVVEPVQVQGALYSPDILLGSIDLGIVDAADDVRGDQCSQNAKDHDDDHDLDQGETCFAVNASICNTLRKSHIGSVTLGWIRGRGPTEIGLIALMISGIPTGQAPATAVRGRPVGWISLAVLGAMILGLQVGGDSVRIDLQYERQAIGEGQVWRLLTGHLVHLGWRHAILNVTGLFLVAMACRGVFDRRAWMVVGLGSLAAVDIGLWALSPEVLWYVGLSGILHGVISAAAVGLLAQRRMLGAIALGVIAIKVIRENWSGAASAAAAWLGGDIVVTAHLWGAIGGILAAVCVIRARDHSGSL